MSNHNRQPARPDGRVMTGHHPLSLYLREHTLRLKEEDIEVIAWYHLDATSRYPRGPGYFEPSLDTPDGFDGFVTLTEKEKFQHFLLDLQDWREEYWEDLEEPSNSDDFGTETDLRRQFIHKVLELSEDMLPPWLHPLNWDLETVLPPATAADASSPDDSDMTDVESETNDVIDEFDDEFDAEAEYEGEMEVVHVQYEPIGPRIETSALAHGVRQPAIGSECAVCLDGATPDEGFVRPPCCQHLFHFSCLDEWLNSGAENSNLCPLCRGVISVNRRATREVVDQDQVNAWEENAT